MTAIIRLSDNQADQLPVARREYRLERDNDDLVAIEKFVVRYNRVPERVFVWRGVMYIETKEEEK